MTKIKLLISVGILYFGIGCTKQPYYNIPTENDGSVVITEVSSTTSDGITTLDESFTVNAFFPNAKEGDTMIAELLKPQTPPGGGADQLFPLSGTQKSIILGPDLKASVSYSRTDAKMMVPGDFVRVTFSGKTASGQKEIKMERATNVQGPLFDEQNIDLIRNAGTALFDIDVQTNKGGYSGEVIAQMKNGANASWSDIGTGVFLLPAQIPISGSDFAVGSDTMYYSFVVKEGAFTDSITRQIVIEPSSFFFKHSGTLSLENSALGGFDLLANVAVQANDNQAILSVENGSLAMKGGDGWMTGSKSVSFVPSDKATFDSNNPVGAIDAFNVGSPAAQADPVENDGIYIFKIVNGSDPSDIFYGMLKVTNIVPGVSFDFDYSIGNNYSQMAVLN